MTIIHASCAALGTQAVLLTGAPGSGKSDVLLRLLDAGFDLVADDRVILDGACASAPPEIAGMIEARGLGLLRVPHRTSPVRVALHVELQAALQGALQGALAPEHGPRLPPLTLHEPTGAWSIRMNPGRPGLVAVIRAALKCRRGEWTLLAGVNGADWPFPSDGESG
ncbi:HPr kinase/phosphorylase [Acidomonas methanolica]|uniref:HPr kinase/phosphorylase n=1 Tax=Acidomonas methanolica TaxID=437 RepID=UPI00211A0ABD|nr:phosphotransferase [Acidomonas methanolica]